MQSKDPANPASDGLDDSFFRYLCDCTGAVVIAADRSLNIVYWNAAASRFFGAEPSARIGTPFLSIFPPESRDSAATMLNTAFEAGEFSELQFSQRDPQDRLRDCSMFLSPIVDSQGHRVAVSAGIRDITRRTQLQKELARTRKLSSMGEMAGALAHHLNNIIGGIVTSADFALCSDDPATLRRALESALKSLARAGQLMDGLLTFAEGIHKETDLGDLREIVYDLADVMDPALRTAGIKLELVIPPLPVIPVPRASVYALLDRLVRNAVEAMPHGGILRLELTAMPDQIELKLIDQGMGISSENMERIFEPFFSTKTDDPTQSSRHPGLGLAVVHGVLKDIGGKITVDSVLGQGTVVTVLLPREEAPGQRKP